ncbi:amino acid permease [Rothia dentocariosa]|nr:amino acid permease [Rothia dentocariosa]TFI33582.1 amino acid permease [Rothia dentocariosa]
MQQPHDNAASAADTTDNAEELHRGLSNRHIQLIAIGGAIGTGLFMGSGKAISKAGPSILLVYIVIGAAIFLVLRAMGEILLSNLKYKSFSDFATDLIGRPAGFFLGWSYWFMWVVTAVADIIAIVGYTELWWPDLPKAVPALVVIIALLALNLPSVKNFGEIEFWFAMIKIVAICALIIVGAIMVATSFTTPSGAHAQVANLWNDGGFFPNGATGFLGAFQIAVFAFMGSELVGTTAAETQNPTVTLPKAINSVPVRILIFYVGALIVILMVNPWREIDPAKSPFVTMFTLAGIAIAAHIVNVVVLTSATSSANSGIFSTSRMVYGLSQEGYAPKFLGNLSGGGVPRNALFLTSILLLSSIALLYAGDSIIEAFTLVTTMAAVLVIFVWSMILVSYLCYRAKRPNLHRETTYPMPGGVVACWIVLAFFAFIIGILATDKDTLTGLMLMPIWFILLTIGWFVKNSINPEIPETSITQSHPVVDMKAPKNNK